MPCFRRLPKMGLQVKLRKQFRIKYISPTHLPLYDAAQWQERLFDCMKPMLYGGFDIVLGQFSRISRPLFPFGSWLHATPATPCDMLSV